MISPLLAILETPAIKAPVLVGIDSLDQNHLPGEWLPPPRIRKVIHNKKTAMKKNNIFRFIRDFVSFPGSHWA